MGFIQNSIKAYLEVKEQEDKRREEIKPQRSVEELEKEIEKLQAELKKAKEDADVKVEPNPDTGEIPLSVGIARGILDKKQKEKKQ
tara:strand:- start:640 stop:897 length:258 start_codon:yes stop_codon:yes gene_type:complete